MSAHGVDMLPGSGAGGPQSWGVWLERVRLSRELKLGVVFIGLMLDNVLLTVVVPIIPEYLIVLSQQEQVEIVSAATGLSLEPPARQDHSSWNDSAYNETYDHWLLNLSIAMENQKLNSSAVTAADVLWRDDALLNENSKVGWLFSSKAIVQLIANPIVGPVTNRYGYTIPMFAGFVVLMISTMLYAFGESFAVLFLARSVQGIASSCTAIAGMTLLAETYPEDRERSKAMGIALGGLALGVLIGYPFGGVMYQFVGKMSPFLVIAVFILLEGVLQLWALQPALSIVPEKIGTPLYVLMMDPYILIAAGAILFPEMAMAMLEPTLPIWLLDTMNPEKWQLGTVFVPDSVGYLIGCNVFGIAAHKLGRWIVSVAALLIMGVCCLCIPLASQISHLIVPHFGLGLALGMVDAAMMPLLALLVDTRHVAVYGSVYAIAQVSIALGFAVGPSLGGLLVKVVGFPWLIRGIAIVNIIYAPLCYFLRRPPGRDETKSILMKDNQEGGGGASYTETESFSYQQLHDE